MMNPHFTLNLDFNVSNKYKTGSVYRLLSDGLQAGQDITNPGSFRLY